MPIALVVGIDHFVAKKLARALLEKDLLVYGVGADGGDLIDDNRFVLQPSGEPYPDGVAYFFDFSQSVDVWKKATQDGAKLTIIEIDKKEVSRKREESVLAALGVNWRIVEVSEVYGPGMELDKNWLGGAIEAAVLNRPLPLPKDDYLRPVAVDDVVEAVLRASFLSGTDSRRWVYGGAKVERGVLAECLEQEAKMTKREVTDLETTTEGEEGVVEDSWQHLRWVPVRDFESTIKETLQYFFAKADEMGRTKNNRKRPVTYKPNYEISKYEVSEILPLLPIKKHEETVEKDVAYEVVPEFEPNESWKKKQAVEVVEEEVSDEIEEKPEGIKKGMGLSWIKPIEVPGPKPESLHQVKDDVKVESVSEEVAHEAAVKPLEPKKVKKSRRRRVGLGLGIVLLMMVIFGGYWGIRLYGIVHSITMIAPLLKQQQWQEAMTTSKETLDEVRSVEEVMSSWGIGGDWDQLVRVVDQGLVVVIQAIPAVENGQKLYTGVFKDKEIPTVEVLADLSGQLEGVDSEMGVLQARLGGEWWQLPGILRNKLQETEKTVANSRVVLSEGRKALAIVPELIGADGKRRDWLVLFQNENELRPSGGFIGSYGILSFENGKLLQLEVRDIYGADGQLKGHVEPPLPIKQYLGEASWYMRDANWQAGFPQAARDILWFSDKETGRSVNGVVAIDLAVARGLLGVVGEVYLPNFKEKVNKDNLYEQAEYYSEQNFFPGSHEKESFLGELSKQLFESIKGLSLDQQLKLVTEVFDLADKNELQIMATEPKTANTLSQLGWDGALYDGGCAKDRCIADYLYVVEANLGVNKANYFINRSMEQLVELSTQSVARVIKINYENTAKSSNWPGGDYKDYIRVYVPNDVNVSQIAMYATDNPAEKTILGSADMTVTTLGSKKEIGFLMLVPVGAKKTVELRYSSGIDMSKGNSFSYLGYIQRQPGYGSTSLVSLVSYPAGWQPLQVQPSASIVGDKLLFNQSFDRDIRMGVELGK